MMREYGHMEILEEMARNGEMPEQELFSKFRNHALCSSWIRLVNQPRYPKFNRVFDGQQFVYRPTPYLIEQLKLMRETATT